MLRIPQESPAINTVCCADYRDFLAALPEGCVDLTVTDPPWGATPQKWDTRPDFRVVSSELARVLSREGQAWFFVRMPWAAELHAEMTKVGFSYRQEIIWEKQNAGGCTIQTWRKVHENLWHYARPGATIFNLGMIREPKKTTGNKSVSSRTASTTQFIGNKNSAYNDDGMRMPRSVRFCRNLHRSPESIGHPTQKPLDIVEPLILYSSNPGQTVLDPFAGAFTTAVAASKLGRSWYACDSDEDWCLKSEARLAAVL